jgi:hypothetical protein
MQCDLREYSLFRGKVKTPLSFERCAAERWSPSTKKTLSIENISKTDFPVKVSFVDKGKEATLDRQTKLERKADVQLLENSSLGSYVQVGLFVM